MIRHNQVVGDDWPELTFPELEAAYVAEAYSNVRVILEYGSGGSTLLAAKMSNKLVFSVESDIVWALNLQSKLDLEGVSPATVYPVNIGRVGSYGRPFDDKNWTDFHRYPTAIWCEAFFRQPDIVLIDGRLRPACFLATCLYIQKPVTILFDDYVNRPRYHLIERLVKPSNVIGRMAEFKLDGPIKPNPHNINLLLELCGTMTYAGRGSVSYL